MYLGCLSRTLVWIISLQIREEAQSCVAFLTERAGSWCWRVLSAGSQDMSWWKDQSVTVLLGDRAVGGSSDVLTLKKEFRRLEVNYFLEGNK